MSPQALVDSLALKSGTDRNHADNMATRHTVVFGGQFLAQSIAAALIALQGKTVCGSTATTRRPAPRWPSSGR